jgi:hypothetical protein
MCPGNTLQNVGNLAFRGKTSKIEQDSTKWDSIVWRASREKSGIIGSDWQVGKNRELSGIIRTQFLPIFFPIILNREKLGVIGSVESQFLGVPEKEQKQTTMSGRSPNLKIFNGTNVLMIQDSVWFFLLVEINIFWWKPIFFGGN